MRLHFVDEQTTFHVTHFLKMRMVKKLIMLRLPLVKMLFIVMFWCLCKYTVRVFFHANEAVNRQIKIRIHFGCIHLLRLLVSLRSLMHSDTPQSVGLVKISHLSQLFFHMLSPKMLKRLCSLIFLLTLKALT